MPVMEEGIENDDKDEWRYGPSWNPPTTAASWVLGIEGSGNCIKSSKKFYFRSLSICKSWFTWAHLGWPNRRLSTMACTDAPWHHIHVCRLRPRMVDHFFSNQSPSWPIWRQIQLWYRRGNRLCSYTIYNQLQSWQVRGWAETWRREAGCFENRHSRSLTV